MVQASQKFLPGESGREGISKNHQLNREFKIVVIGGSAGSFPVVRQIVSSLPEGFGIPIIMCLHRLKEIRNGLVESLSSNSSLIVSEPEDKSAIRPGNAYLAPANYHLLVEPNRTFSLSIDGEVNFSRPSIDLTFETAGLAFRDKMLGIILSGANVDGARGLSLANQNGAFTVVQDPQEALVRTMPEKALQLFEPDLKLVSEDIVSMLKNIG
jgi:two-component system chemotaxis response regulator CheB